MAGNVKDLERLLGSPSKKVRLKALKMILRHPNASPLQIVQALCSDNFRNSDWLNEFEIDSAVRTSWARLDGIDDDQVYSFLESLYHADADRNREYVVHVLELIGTPKTAALLSQIKDTTPEAKRYWIDRVLSAVARRTHDTSNSC